jgi:hypothetical protein
MAIGLLHFGLVGLPVVIGGDGPSVIFRHKAGRPLTGAIFTAEEAPQEIAAFGVSMCWLPAPE